jgi:hypothetical protein
MKNFKLFITVPIILVAVYAISTRTNGVMFTLKNVGATTLHSVLVEVSGASYALGDVTSGASKTVKINPHRESDIKLRFTNSRGLLIDRYVDSDFGGTIEANVTEQEVVSVKDKSTPPSLF